MGVLSTADSSSTKDPPEKKSPPQSSGSAAKTSKAFDAPRKQSPSAPCTLLSNNTGNELEGNELAGLPIDTDSAAGIESSNDSTLVEGRDPSGKFVQLFWFDWIVSISSIPSQALPLFSRQSRHVQWTVCQMHNEQKSGRHQLLSLHLLLRRSLPFGRAMNAEHVRLPPRMRGRTRNVLNLLRMSLHQSQRKRNLVQIT